jgi:hypothetical protein
MVYPFRWEFVGQAHVTPRGGLPRCPRLPPVLLNRSAGCPPAGETATLRSRQAVPRPLESGVMHKVYTCLDTPSRHCEPGGDSVPATPEMRGVRRRQGPGAGVWGCACTPTIRFPTERDTESPATSAAGVGPLARGGSDAQDPGSSHPWRALPDCPGLRWVGTRSNPDSRRPVTRHDPKVCPLA